MVEKILHTLGGIERYGIVSMSLFILVFVGVLLWALFQKKSHLDYMARVALDPEPERGCLSGPASPPAPVQPLPQTTLAAAAAETATLRPAARPPTSSIPLP